MSVLAKSKVISTEELQTSEAKWVTLKKLNWQDPTGKNRIWEMASRKTQPKSGLDAVSIFPLITSASNAFPPSTVIIEQYRPPLKSVLIEFPAGLVDEDESPEKAAVRELHEETGFQVQESDVVDVSPLLGSDPGLTNATMKLVTVKIEVPASQKQVPEPKQRLDEGEFIIKRTVALKDLYNTLQEYSKQGCTIDAKLSHFAAGINLAKSLA